MEESETAEAEFIADNERKVNRAVSHLMLPGVLVGLSLVVLRLLKVFPDARLSVLAAYTAVQLAFWTAARVLIKKRPRSRATKYFCLLSIEAATLFLSLAPGLVMFISFLIVPMMSVLYFDRRFSARITFVGFVAMLASILFRNVFSFYGSGLSEPRLRAAFCAGCSIEYALCAVLVVAATGRMRRSIDEQFAQTKRIKEMQERLIVSVAELIESKDASTGQHIQRTARYVERICAKMLELGYYPDELNERSAAVMVKAAPLHDMGKMKVPETILEKPGRLSDEEFDVIKMHPLWGHDIIQKTFSGIEDEEFTQCALEMALTHHEWWNGRGYPLRLVGDEIPLCGRIMAAADVLDALLTVRPYKRAFTIDETMNIFVDNAGTQFDPLVAEAVLQIETEIAFIQIDTINDYTIKEARAEETEF